MNRPLRHGEDEMMLAIAAVLLSFIGECVAFTCECWTGVVA